MKNMDPKKLSGLHVFYHPFSNCAGRVLLALGEKNLEAEEHFINLMKSEQLSEAYIRINPKGEVPAIVHDGRAMHESCEILRYLEQTFPEPTLTPTDPNQRQIMNQLLDAAAASHESGIVNYVYANGYGRLPTPKDWAFYQDHIPHRTQFHIERRLGKVASNPVQAEAELHKQFSRLELALQHQPWLTGNQYSLADIAWYPNTIILRALGFDFSPFPKVKQWVKRIEQRPEYKRSLGKKLPKLPYWLLRPVIRLALKLKRKTGNRC